MQSLVGYQLADSVATITMDDGKVNALSPQMITEISQALDRALASSRNRSDALENVLKGMIATRRRDYDEARDAYMSAMHELSAINNEVEYAKTALKFATMVLQKATDGKRDRNELRDGVNRLNEALRIFHEFGLHEQYAHTEYMINALERTAIGIIF